VDIKLLRKREVETVLGISRATVDRPLAAGELRLVRVGRRAVRIPSTAVEALIRRGQFECSPRPSGDGR
jgi:excisionase family DNA binding protein